MRERSEAVRVPQTWADLADDIGPVAALALSAAYGGVNVYVPGKMTRSHAIARLFEATGAGFGAALALSELHGDTTLHVPRLSVFFRIRQAARALELLHGGATPQQAADALGISTKTLRRTLAFAKALALRARCRRDSRRLRSEALRAAAGAWQLSLFDLQVAEDWDACQNAAGRSGSAGRMVQAESKESPDAASGADAQNPRHAGRAARARRAAEHAAVGGA